MSNQIIEKVVEQLETLPSPLQQQVLEFAVSIKPSTVQGIPGSQLLQFANSISQDELQLISQSIEAGCEQVNLDEW